MDWVKTMNEAITYIEEHLSENIGLSDIAKVTASVPLCKGY